MCKVEKYWKKRAEKYNSLEWVHNNSYMNNFCKVADLNSNHLILDIGSGTGAVANHVKKYVKEVFALDISYDMLKNGFWKDISLIHWDIRKKIFYKNIFDRITARMVFHHILKNQNKAIKNCYDCLKKTGKIIISEGIPPSISDLVVNWYSEMFSYKEDRLIFLPGDLEKKLTKVGFLNVKSFLFSMPNFNINNWINNSGLSKNKINKIIKMHIEAPEEVKQAYNMKISKNNILINSQYLVIVGEK